MPCLRPIDVFNRKAGKSFLVPCGKCDECLHRRKMSYVFRCEQEKLHGDFSHCYFITLTYSDSYLPYESYSEKKGGSPVNPVSTGESLLCSYDLTQFFKRYRLFVGDSIRYFACGEYGDRAKTHRPHYHIILFCNQDWKTCVKNSELAWSYLVAETAEDRKSRYKLQRKLGKTIKRDSRSMVNRELIGRVQVKSVTYKRICYVSKYCNKLLFQDEVVKPFIRLSNGLGSNFLDTDTVDICKQQNRHYTYFENGLPVAIPRYFSHRMFTLDQMSEFQLKMIENTSIPLELLDDSVKVVEWVRNFNAGVLSHANRARLARYGILKFYG